MPIVLSEILSNATDGGRSRLIYRHVDELGIVYGPWVEHRPIGEDHNAWLATNAVSLADALASAELEANAQEALEGA